MRREAKTPGVDIEERLMARIAWAYHVEGLTQGEVAERLGLTRLRVNRALAEIRKQGLVRITFNTAFAACFELERALCEQFSLKQAYVAPSPADPNDTQMVVGSALGHLLSEILADPEPTSVREGLRYQQQPVLWPGLRVTI